MTPPPVPSSGTLWATASREWIIPAKPKPGRKPKKDIMPSTKVEKEIDSKGRRAQNRAAQRAFRERKQSQLTELQARVQYYEQQEIEGNVTLQNIAKRLKVENEKLRSENFALKERMSEVEAELGTPPENSRKRCRENSSSFSSISADSQPRKRLQVTPKTSEVNLEMPPFAYISSPLSTVSSSDSNESFDGTFTPFSFGSPQESHPPSSLGSLLDLPTSAKVNRFGVSYLAFSCGFCNEDTPCVCREIAFQQAAAERTTQSSLKVETFEQSGIFIPVQRAEPLGLKAPAEISILDNLPSYQPPVPLHRRIVSSDMKNIFRISYQSQSDCSGDPENCAACAGDSFGRAFCEAIGESIVVRCTSCPNREDGIHQPFSGCCRAGGPSNFVSLSPAPTPTILHPPTTDLNLETIPTNVAWRQIKSHPNIEFTDLALLADVVARRSKCTGQNVVACHASCVVTAERNCSAFHTPSRLGDVGQSVLLTDPHAHYQREQESVSEALIKCNQKRVLRVHTDAVKDALRILDAKC